MDPESPRQKSKEHWLMRAEDAHRSAEKAQDRISNDTFLSIAQSCEVLARHAKPEAELLPRLGPQPEAHYPKFKVLPCEEDHGDWYVVVVEKKGDKPEAYFGFSTSVEAVNWVERERTKRGRSKT
jgi:hypothetical protein